MAGALDCFGHDRAAMMAGVERMMGLAALAQQNATSGQADMFGASLGGQSQALNLPPPSLAAGRKAAPRIPGRRLLSLGPSARRIQVRAAEDAGADLGRVLRRREAGATAGRLAGTVTSKQERKTRTGNKMGVVQLLRRDRPVRGRAVLRRRWRSTATCSSRAGRVVITVAAEDRPEGINLRIQTVQSLEDDGEPGAEGAAHLSCAMPRPVGTLAGQLGGQGRGAGQLRRHQGRRRRARSRSSCRTATASRRRSPRRCAPCRASSRWNWSDACRAAVRVRTPRPRPASAAGAAD